MDQVKAAAKSLLGSLTRRRAKPVAFADLNHVEPVSRRLGWERGMPIDRYLFNHFLRSTRAKSWAMLSKLAKLNTLSSLVARRDVQ